MFRSILHRPYSQSSSLVILVIAAVLTFSGCGNTRRGRAPAPTSPAPQEVTSTPPAPQEVTSTPIDDAAGNENDAPATPEQIKQQEINTAIAENLPDAEISRKDFENLIESTEQKFGENGGSSPIQKTEPKPHQDPAPVIATVSTGLLTQVPDLIVAKPDATRVKPDATRVKPDATRVKPDATRVKPPVIVDSGKSKPMHPSSTWPKAPPKNDRPPTPKNPPAERTPVETPPKKAPTPATRPPEKTPPSEESHTGTITTANRASTGDNGVDPEDEQQAEAYAGPKTVVDHPHSTADFQLSEVAAQLGAMAKKDYRKIQKEAIGTDYRACNYFLVTALVKSRIADEDHLPMYRASTFDSKYFVPKGWKRISLETMKKWFREGKTFDVAIQKPAPRGKSNGHVAIPIGLNDQGNVLIAEGVLETQSNRIVTYSDHSLSEKFKIFARD